MKKLSNLRKLACLATALAVVHEASSQSVWNVVVNQAANTNWSTAANWTPSGVPGAAANATFNDTTGVADFTTNSVVDGGSFGGTIGSLTFTNFSSYQNVLLTNGLTITGSGGLTLGNAIALTGTAMSPITTISGYGSLVVNNSSANMNVGVAEPSTSGTATLVLTNLSNFSFTGARVMIGVAGGNRTTGVLLLSRTNVITANGSSPQIDIGDNGGNNGPGSTLYLGQTNVIYADNIAMGRQKQNSGGGGSLRFHPSFTNDNMNPVAYFRGHDGISPVTSWAIADGATGGGTITDSGTSDFSGGTLNAVVTSLVLAKNGTGANAGSSANNATFTFSSGSLVVGNLTNAMLASSKQTPTVTGNFNLNGPGTLVVTNAFAIAMLNSFSPGTANGTVTIAGGTCMANTIIAGGGNSTFNMVGGSLYLTNNAGTAAQPLSSFSVSNSTLQVSVPSSIAAPINATSITADGQVEVSNTINIVSLPAGVSSGSAVPLLQSVNGIALNYGNFNFALGTLPAGYAGNLGLSTDGLAVVLNLTKTPLIGNLWTGADIPNHNTNWSDGLNWSMGTVPSGSAVFFNTTASQSGSALSSPGAGPSGLLAARINNIVDANFTIFGLNYSNISSSFENTFIANNTTLNITGTGLTVGSQSVDYGDTIGNVTISGPAGTLEVSNTTASIYVGLGSASGTPQARLDLSALGTLDTTVANFLVGVGGFTSDGFTVPQAAGLVYLGRTNVISAVSSAPNNSDAVPVALEVGDVDTAGGTVGSTLYLGLTNAIFADNIAVGRQLGAGSLLFNPSVISSAPSVTFRGVRSNLVSSWNIGDGVINSGNAMAAGTNDFTGGSVDALVNTLTVARSSGSSYSVLPVNGVLTFNAGSISANTVNVSLNNTNADGNVYNFAVGTLNVNGTGTLMVNNNLNLALTPGPLGGGSPVGTLNITNGAAWINNIVAGSNNAASSISVSSGTLGITNSAGSAIAPLTALYLTNSSLYLGLTNLLTPIAVTTLNLDGPAAVHNVLNIISLPAIATYPVTFTLIKSVNPINPVGGAFNFQLGSLPSSAYSATIGLSDDQTSVFITVNSGPTGVRPSVTWTGADLPSLNTNWSDRLNWQLPGAPQGADNLIFNNLGAASASALSTPGGGATGLLLENIDNIVDATTAISSLTFTNVGGTYHNTQLKDGVSLNVTNSGGVTVGSGTQDFGGGATGFVTVTGPKSVLNISNTGATVFVGLGNTSSGSEQATLDLSALGTLNASVSRWLIGVGSASGGFPTAREAGTVYLAQTNTITASVAVSGTETSDTSGSAAAVDIGDNNGNAGLQCYLYLGQTNAIFGDAICVARQKGSGQMLFNPTLINSGSDPAAYFRGHDGVSPVGIWSLADGVVNSGTVSPVGINDFTGGRVDALVSTMYIGRGANNSTGTGTATGTLTFDGGTINVNTLYAGYEPASGSKLGIGTINVNRNSTFNRNGTLVVSGVLNLASTTGGAGAAGTSGTLNINNGTVLANAIVAGDLGATSTINLTGGNLAITNTAGSPATPITDLNLNGGTLTLHVYGNSVTNVVATSVSVSAFTTINIGAIANISSPTVVPLISYTGTDPFANLVLGTKPFGYSCTLQDNTANNTIDLSITPPPTLTWVGAVGSTLNSTWNAGTLNWKNGGSPAAYVDPDYALFNDSASNGIVTLATTLSPGGVTVNNSTLSYTFNGGGKLTGNGGLNKQGSGTLLLAETGGDNFSGGIAVNNGTLIIDSLNSSMSGGSTIANGATLQVGNNDGNGDLPSGSVTMNGTLVFSQTADQTLDNVITGIGNLVQSGANSLTLSASNSFSGTVTVQAGSVLRIDNNSALGTTNVGTTVNTGGTLDVGAPDIAANGVTVLEPFTVSGTGVNNNGAIINSYTNQQFNALRFVTLAGDTSFGGTGPWNPSNGNPGRWDIRGSSSSSSNAVLSTSGHAFNLVKTGLNQISLVGATVDPALGNIDVQQGLLGFEGGTTGMGNPASNLTVRAGAAISFFNSTNFWNKVFVLNGNGSTVTVTNWSGTNIVIGPVTLNGNCLFGVSSNAQLVLTNNTVSGSGSLTKITPGTLVLAGSSSYTGNTTVNDGTLAFVGTAAIPPSPLFEVAGSTGILDLNRAGGVLTLGAGQTLRGIGTVWASVTNAPGSTNAPGRGIGTLTVASNIVLQGTTVIELDKSNAATNDVLSSPSVALGGTLVVTNINPGAPLVAGDSFKLFNTANLSGSFNVTILPTLDSGLAWDTRHLSNNGIVSVVVSTTPPSPGITNIVVSGGNLVLRGTASPSLANKTYYELSSTNAALPRANWTVVLTNTFDANGGFSVTNAVNPGMRSLFFQIDIPWPQ